MTATSDATNRQELLDELAKLRRRIVELEDSELKCRISEEALRRSETKYKQLVELLPQVVYEIDAQGNFSFMNCTGLASFGYDAEDLAQGIKALDLVTSEFAYARFIGDRKAIEAKTKRWDKLIEDKSDEMKVWINELKKITDKGIKTYAFFNNHYAGFAPGSIKQFEDLWQQS